ncbi:MAG: DUF4375 domain-containing protein [Pedobacter sp.]|nr:DUF4375 domain-containing protein [Pedobacter sp.]
MKLFKLITLFVLVYGCAQHDQPSKKTMNASTEQYNSFDKKNHLQPEINKLDFDTLHRWDLGWALLEPINIASDDEHEKLLSKRLSPGQKALYFFWYLDAEVINGGFSQFYQKGYRKFLPPILAGLQLIGDNELFELVKKADAKYEVGRNDFDELDEVYYRIHDRTMDLIEKYARQHPNEFGKFE